MTKKNWSVDSQRLTNYLDIVKKIQKNTNKRKSILNFVITWVKIYQIIKYYRIDSQELSEIEQELLENHYIRFKTSIIPEIIKLMVFLENMPVDQRLNEFYTQISYRSLKIESFMNKQDPKAYEEILNAQIYCSFYKDCLDHSLLKTAKKKFTNYYTSMSKTYTIKDKPHFPNLTSSNVEILPSYSIFE
jgi:hypothetical protein